MPHLTHGARRCSACCDVLESVEEDRRGQEAHVHQDRQRRLLPVVVVAFGVEADGHIEVPRHLRRPPQPPPRLLLGVGDVDVVRQSTLGDFPAERSRVDGAEAVVGLEDLVRRQISVDARVDLERHPQVQDRPRDDDCADRNWNLLRHEGLKHSLATWILGHISPISRSNYKFISQKLR